MECYSVMPYDTTKTLMLLDFSVLLIRHERS